MIAIDYPKTGTQLDLTKIFTIETDNTFDTIYLGYPNLRNCLGFIGSVDGQFLFKTADTSHEFTPKNSYAECLLDVFILIANDPDHAQEFAVRSLRKVLDSDYYVV
jgi:hypothetical protein